MSTKNILLTGGRAPVTLDLARQLHVAGYRIFVAESLPYHLCRTSSKVEKNFQVSPPNQLPSQYIKELRTIIENEQIDHLLPTCEEIFTIAQGIKQLPSSCQVWSESIERLDLFHNKWRFIQCVKNFGWKTPKTWLIRSNEELKERLRQVNPQQPWILKPVYSRFSSQIIRLEHAQSLIPESCDISDHSPWLLQEWVNGRQICTYSFVIKGKMLAYAAYPTLFTAGQGTSILFQPYENPSLQKKIEQLLASYRLTGQFAFDWIQTAENEWIPIECNPRSTSGIHLLSSTADWRIILGDAEKPDSVCFTPAPHSNRMIGLAMCTYGLASIRSLADLWRWLQTFGSSKDVLFQLDDIRPFFDQFRIVMHLYSRSKKLNLSLTKSSTYDIEWNGDFK